MGDVVDSTTRSRMMAGIRSKNTQPELAIRSGLHRHGFRFRLHDKRLPGKPDLVLPKYSAVIFVHGCFWHGHGCRIFKWPATRTAFWRDKIGRNRANDERHRTALHEAGWRVCTVWECALRPAERGAEAVTRHISRWLKSSSRALEISA
jgi:DNA mismatch endonuclease (patch repair protein)